MDGWRWRWWRWRWRAGDGEMEMEKWRDRNRDRDGDGERRWRRRTENGDGDRDREKVYIYVYIYIYIYIYCWQTSSCNYRGLRTPSNYFIFSLALSDLLLGLVYPVYTLGHVNLPQIKASLGEWFIHFISLLYHTHMYIYIYIVYIYSKGPVEVSMNVFCCKMSL